MTTDILTTIKDYLMTKRSNPFGQRIYLGYPKVENLTPVLGISLLSMNDPLKGESKGLGIAYEWNVSFTMFFKQGNLNQIDSAVRFVLTSMDNLDRTKYIAQQSTMNTLEEGNTVQVTLDIKITGCLS